MKKYLDSIRSFLLKAGLAFFGIKTFSELSVRRFLNRTLALLTLLIVSTLTIGAFLNPPCIGWAFGECDLLTWFSFFLLITAGLICKKIGERSLFAEEDNGSSQSTLWRLLYLGFIFLAFDELLRIHERIDELFHKLLGIEENALTDHLDDLIIVIYGLIGFFVLLLYWREALKLLQSWRLIFFAILCSVLTVLFDFIGNSRDFFVEVFGDHQLAERVISFIDVIEDSFKLYGEIFFVATFLAVLKGGLNHDQPEDRIVN